MVSRITVTSDPYHQVDIDVLGDITRCILGVAWHSNLK